MSLKIKSDSTFLLSPKNKKLLSNSKTDEKTSSIANQLLEKSNTIWYTEPLLDQNEKSPFIKKLSPNTFPIIYAELKIPQTKPIPPPRAPTTCLSPKLEYSKTYEQRKPFGPDLLPAIINARKALKPIDPSVPFPRRSHLTCLTPKQEYSEIVDLETPVKNTSPLSLLQKNTAQSESVILSTNAVKKRVSFQIEIVTKDKSINSQKKINHVMKRLPLQKSILLLK